MLNGIIMEKIRQLKWCFGLKDGLKIVEHEVAETLRESKMFVAIFLNF